MHLPASETRSWVRRRRNQPTGDRVNKGSDCSISCRESGIEARWFVSRDRVPAAPSPEKCKRYPPEFI
ncbi:hypothetical protein GWI33_005361 [Rhynchophorus ferrugineus]|uniref:Uncharacterized protein n=1 Tax=Rhynchophorus ferrugineus TaxID=354439 RepID=A0A834IWS3_RHYFE|nr:hypothetical protein GWI33_005361 [Rhynchophorus ferrugineus]